MKTKILLLATICTLAACQATTPSSQNTASVSTATTAAQRVWQLSELPEFAEPQLKNTVMDWSQLPQANANMGCNNLKFQVNLDNAGSLKVDDRIIATRMYCADTMALETAFTQHISKMKRYRVENNNTLILDNQAGLQMKFIAK